MYLHIPGCIRHQFMTKERKAFLTGKVAPASNRIVSENKVFLYFSCFFSRDSSSLSNCIVSPNDGCFVKACYMQVEKLRNSSLPYHKVQTSATYQHFVSYCVWLLVFIFNHARGRKAHKASKFLSFFSLFPTLLFNLKNLNLPGF